MNISLSLILAIVFILLVSVVGRKIFKLDRTSFPLLIIFYIFIGIVLSFPLKSEVRFLSPFFLLSLGIVGFIEGASMDFLRLKVKTSVLLPLLKFFLFFAFFYFSFHFISANSKLSLIFATVFAPVSFYGLEREKILLASFWELFSIMLLPIIFSFFNKNFLRALVFHIILGILLGIIAYITLGIKASRGERNAIIIGLLTLGAASASYLSLSPIFVGFIGGFIYANLPRFVGVEVLLPQILVPEKPAFLFILIFLGMFSAKINLTILLLALGFLFLKSVPAIISKEPGYLSIPPISVAIFSSVYFHFRDKFSPEILPAFTLSFIFMEIVEYTVLNYRKRGNIILKRGR